MFPPLSLESSLQLGLAIALVAAGFLRFLHRAAWQRRGIKLLYVAVFGVLLLAHAAWSVGESSYFVSYWGALVASAGLVLAGLVVLSLPLAALVRVLLAPKKMNTVHASAPDHASTLTRRHFASAAAALVPAAAMATGLRGFSSAARPVSLRAVPVTFPRLHPALEGFTILQLSDLHLGVAKDVGDLEHFFERLQAARRRPDLIVFTGDVADNLGELGPALRLAHQFGAPHGVLASLGNHEYLYDIARVRSIFDKSPVPLLVGDGLELRVGGARLHVGGADDPVIIHGNIHPFLEDTVSSAMRHAPRDAFRLLLSHRPEGFDPAAALGVDLTLSGHTHGGLIGFNDKSAFEPIWPEDYLWGSYRRGASRLYTTSGFGDWFPFRLGCPMEAPLIVFGSEEARKA